MKIRKSELTSRAKIDFNNKQLKAINMNRISALILYKKSIYTIIILKENVKENLKELIVNY